MQSLLIKLIKADQARWRALEIVETLGVETACIGAGFVRNLVWDYLHHRTSDCRPFDLDVLWFDRDRVDPKIDSELERRLNSVDPSFDWSVKNQARMHLRNDDPPYQSVADAMRYWPETATAIAARRIGDTCEIIAPFGVHDLMNIILRPTSSQPHKLRAFEVRQEKKEWTSRWPEVRIAPPHAD